MGICVMSGIWGRRTRGYFSRIAKDTTKMDFGNEEYLQMAENDTSYRIMEWNGFPRREIISSEMRWNYRDVTPSEKKTGWSPRVPVQHVMSNAFTGLVL